MSLRFLSCLFLVLVILSTAALAPIAGAQNRVALQLLDEAQQLRRAGNDEQALVVLAQAVELERTPRAVAQFGLVHHALGHFAKARLLLIEALAHQRDTWIASRKPALETALGDCSAHVGRVFVEGAQPGDAIVCDGAPCGTAPLSEPLVLDARSATIAIVRNGVPVAEGIIVVPPAGEVTFAFAASVATQVAGSTDAASTGGTAETNVSSNSPAPSASNALTPWAWTAIGVGAAGLGAGVVLHVLREGDAGEYNDLACTTRTTNAERCTTLYDRINPLTAGAIAGYALGGALVATGVVLLLLPPSGDDNSSASAITCTPTFGLTTGIFCNGAF